MLNKEQFCKIMDKFEKQYRESEEWTQKIYDVFGGTDFWYEHTYLDVVISTIETVMDCKEDRDGYTWITWWIYEDDFGKNELAVELNGKKYTLVTHEDLYELMMEDRKCDS